MKTLRIIGNFVKPIEKVLINKLNAQLVKTETNYFDQGSYTYTIKNVQINVFLEEGPFVDKTFLSSDNNKVIDQIVELIGEKIDIIPE